MSNIPTPLFVRTPFGAQNVSHSTSVVFEESYLIALDSACNKVLFESTDAVELFQRVITLVKPPENGALKLANGGFIDFNIIKSAYISPKSDNLLITGLNDKLLCLFRPDDYSDLDRLSSAISNMLCAVSDGDEITDINWTEYKK
jgi:hypothetical protein